MADADPTQVLRGHLGEVQSLAFLSEGHLYTGDNNGELRFWDLATCRAVHTTRLHDSNAGIMHLACLPRHRVLVSQGRDGCVRLWAAGDAGALDRTRPVCEIRTDSFNFCRCAVWAPGGAADTQGLIPASTAALQDVRVACAAQDPADAAVWRPAESPTAAVYLRQGGFETKHGMCMSLAFLPHEPSPASPSQPASPAEGRSASTQQASEASAEGPLINAGAEEQNNTAGHNHCRGDSSSSGSESGGSSADPWFIVTGYEDGVLALWDLRSPGRPLGSQRVHQEPVMCVDVRAAGGGRPARGPTAVSGTGADSRRAGRAGGPEMAAAGTGSTATYDLVSGSADDQIACCVLRPGEAQPLGVAKVLKLREAGTADVRIRADGKLFACGCWDGRTRLYSLRRREPLAVLKYHRNQVTSLAFSPLTNMLATASRDSTVALWSVYANTAQRQ